MRTLLFDIDGTLLQSAGGGREAMRQALEIEFGVKNPRVEISFSGRTDRFLLAELLTENELPCDDRNQGRLRRRYVELLPQYLIELGGVVFPGVRELLHRLVASSDLQVAVMTGNLPETATRKLQHFDLMRYVQWISGGDLDVDRNALARRTLTTIARRFGESATQNVVVIGDTPLDVQCGHAIGAAVVAVCTGGYGRAELEQGHPTSVWNDFSDWQGVYELLVSDDLTRRHGRFLRGD